MLIDPELQRTAQTHLETDEKLLWAGKPDAKRMAMQTVSNVLFGIVWTAFLINFVRKWFDTSFRMHSGFSYSWDLPLLIFMIPFAGIGIRLLLSPLWTYLQALKTVYAMTDRRMLVIVPTPRPKICSYSAQDIGIIARVDISNGAGDLFYAQRKDQEGDKGKFIGIPDVSSVETLMRSVFKKQ